LRAPLLAALLLITSGLCSSLAAQDRSRIWLGLGFGSGARADGATGAALMAELVYQVRAHHFAIRALGVIDPYGEGADEFGEFATSSCTTLGVPIVAEAALRFVLFLQLGWLP
jgi:hypothetical protein